MDGNHDARDQLIDGLCEEGAYSAESAIYMADAYRKQVLREGADMKTRYVLLLWHLDRSGIQQAFGPYDSEAEAERARDGLKTWPALNAAANADCWTIQPCMATA